MRDTILTAAGDVKLGGAIRIVTVIGTAVMLGLVLELVRRRRLAERYALVWLIVSVVLLVLAIWTTPLSEATKALDIKVPANLLFLTGFAVSFLMLLNFSVISSRLSEETKVLAQEVARLDAELRAERAARENGAQPDGSEVERAPRSASTADQ